MDTPTNPDVPLRVFVDTPAWIALLDETDRLHAPAREVWDRLRLAGSALVTTEFVLLEVANALAAPAARAQAVSFINGVRRAKVVRTLPVDPELFAEAWTLFSRRPDKDWALTDCISFIVMRHEAISQAFTSDPHFEEAGFVKLLAAS
jgi:uncharacterized protein